MIKTLIGTIAAFAIATTGYSASYKTTKSEFKPSLQCVETKGELVCKELEEKVDGILMTPSNTVVLRGVVNEDSASKFVKQFMQLENSLKTEIIYVYINSPGGSVFAGETIAHVMRASKKQVVTIVENAFSMGFYVSNFGHKRVILPHGILMQHHASGGAGQGEFPNVTSFWNFINRKIDLMRKHDADSCKMSVENFLKNIERDWWLLAPEALKAGCTDKVEEKVVCSVQMSEETVSEKFSFLGIEVEVVFSQCPFESAPRAINIKSLGHSTLKSELTEQQIKVIDMLKMSYTSPKLFWQIYGDEGHLMLLPKK